MGERTVVFWRKTWPRLHGFLATRSKSQAPGWSQTPLVKGLFVGAASRMPITAKHWHSGVSLQRQYHANLPGAVSTAGHHGLRGPVDTTRLLASPSVITSRGSGGSRADGGGGGMLRRGSQADQHAFQFMSYP